MIAVTLSITSLASADWRASESGAGGVSAPSAMLLGAAPPTRVSAPDLAGAAVPASPALQAASPSDRSGRCSRVIAAVKFYSARVQFWAHKMGRHAATARERSSLRPTGRAACPKFLAKRLRAKAAAYRVRWERWRTLHDFDVRPGYSAWRMAVDEVQKAYPDTKAWLLSCSASEGGWGRFVWNTQGSGCGGWLQYVPSTFVGFFARAELDARRRGFRVPRSANSLYSPLGQALAGAWAYRNGLSFHWYGSGC